MIFTQLVLIFKDPIDRTTRDAAAALHGSDSVSVDLRGEDYLIRELSKNSKLYSRYFLDPIKQIQHFLTSEDPLAVADDELKRAILASIGAFVLHDEADNIFQSLKDKLVLTMAVTLGGDTTVEHILRRLREIAPPNTIDRSQVINSIGRLSTSGLCHENMERVRVSPNAIDSLQSSISKINLGFSTICESVIDEVRKRHSLDDATRARVEKNLQRCLLAILRRVGPSITAPLDVVNHIESIERDASMMLSRDLKPDVGHTVLLALDAAVRKPQAAEYLNHLAMSYYAYFLRDQDLYGRNFERDALRRSLLCIDTDVILSVIIAELPTHATTLRALRSLQWFFSHYRGWSGFSLGF